jgi:hypothetical protein
MTRVFAFGHVSQSVIVSINPIYRVSTPGDSSIFAITPGTFGKECDLQYLNRVYTYYRVKINIGAAEPIASNLAVLE